MINFFLLSLSPFLFLEALVPSVQSAVMSVSDKMFCENILEYEQLRCSVFRYVFLKDKSGVDKIIVKKQPHHLLNTNREFFPSFDASNFHKLVHESSYVKPNIVAIFYFVRICKSR